MKILIVGDFAPKERVRSIIDSGNGEKLLSSVKSILQNVDYSLVNLEAPYCKTLTTPIKKRGPHLISSYKALELIKSIGFKCCTLANNHINDYGSRGILDTLAALDQLGIDHVGLGMNLLEAERPLVKKINGQTVAFINICENEYSISDKDTPGASPINPIRNFKQISESKKIADFSIVIVHGGHEHYQLPSPRMKELYHFYIDLGADAVVNHHQHCFSGYEYYKSKPILYGLGNFCFDSKKRMNSSWNYGYMCLLSFNNGNVGVSAIPYKQGLADISLRFLEGTEKSQFEKEINNLNKIISDDNLLEKSYFQFIRKKKKAVIGVFAPYPSEYLREAASRGYLPTLLNDGQTATILNYIMCESQRDVTIGVLKELLNH